MQDVDTQNMADVTELQSTAAEKHPEDFIDRCKTEPMEEQDVDMQKDVDMKDAMEHQEDNDDKAELVEDKKEDAPDSEISPTKSDKDALDLVHNKNVGVQWPMKHTFAGILQEFKRQMGY